MILLKEHNIYNPTRFRRSLLFTLCSYTIKLKFVLQINRNRMSCSAEDLQSFNKGKNY